MNAYFDSSALIPLVVDEPTSGPAREFWRQANHAFGLSISLLECHAGVARKLREGRLTARSSEMSAKISGLFLDIDTASIDDALISLAIDLIRKYPLKTIDALQLAAAKEALSTDSIFVTGDRTLARAAEAENLAVALLAA